MSNKLKPNYNHAVLQPLEDGERNMGGIVIPDMGNETSRMATIIEISPTYNFNLGETVEPLFKVGDVVLIPPMAGVKVKVEGVDYIVATVTDILAAVEQE